GLAVGRLHPWSVRGEGPSSVAVDPTGLDVGADPRPAGGLRDPGATFLAPEVKDGTAVRPTPEADVYALGAPIAWLRDGRAPAAERPVGVAPAARALVRAMLVDDPSDRPTAHEVERGLLGLLGSTARWEASVAVTQPDATIEHTVGPAPTVAET